MIFISEKVENYAISVSRTPGGVCQEIADYTKAFVPMSIMLTGPMEGAFLGILIRAIGAKRILEVGTYTGYSALAMAECLPEDGTLITLDQNPETSAIAQKFWNKSPHGKKIELKMGPALQSLAQLTGKFDFVFIDAAKTEYEAYVDRALELLSPKGLIAIDNTLYAGMVLDPDVRDPRPQAIRQLNQRLKERDDLHVVLLPIRDGVTIVQKA